MNISGFNARDCYAIFGDPNIDFEVQIEKILAEMENEKKKEIEKEKKSPEKTTSSLRAEYNRLKRRAQELKYQKRIDEWRVADRKFRKFKQDNKYVKIK